MLIFRYLTDAEEATLLERAGLSHFEAESVILQEGSEHSAIHVIKRGSVMVTKESAGFPLELSRLGPGQIFGEMSFIEGIPASASVATYDEGVDAYVIEGRLVEELMEKDPAFFGRFYKSLAEILSRRLRDTSALVGAITDGEWAPPE